MFQLAYLVTKSWVKWLHFSIKNMVSKISSCWCRTLSKWWIQVTPASALFYQKKMPTKAVTPFHGLQELPSQSAPKQKIISSQSLNYMLPEAPNYNTETAKRLHKKTYNWWWLNQIFKCRNIVIYKICCNNFTASTLIW